MPQLEYTSVGVEESLPRPPRAPLGPPATNCNTSAHHRTQRASSEVQEAPTVPSPAPNLNATVTSPESHVPVATSESGSPLSDTVEQSFPPAPRCQISRSLAATGDYGDNTSTPGLAFFSKSSQATSSVVTPSSTNPQGHGVAQHQKSTPTSVPVTPRSTTSTTFSQAFGTTYDLGVHSLPSLTIHGQPRPDSLASSLDAGAYIARHGSPRQALKTIPGSSPTKNVTPMDASHAKQELDSSTVRAGHPAQSTKGRITVDSAHQARQLYVDIFGRNPTDEELLWLRDPCRFGSYHPAVVLMPGTPGSGCSAATSAQYVLADDRSEHCRTPSSTLSDPFRVESSGFFPADSESLDEPRLKSHFSSDSDLAFPLADSDLDDNERGGVDGDESEGEVGGNQTEQEGGKNLDHYEDNGWSPYTPSTPPRRPPRPEDGGLHVLVDPSASPTQRVEQHILECAVARISSESKVKSKGKSSRPSMWLRNLGGKEILDKIKERLLPPAPIEQGSGPNTPRARSPSANTPSAPNPVGSTMYVDPSRNAIDLDPRLRHPPMGLTAPSPKLRPSRSEANMGNRFAGGPGLFRTGVSAPAVDYNHDQLLQTDFWLQAPFLPAFLAPLSIVVDGCDGTPVGHHLPDGTKACPCPSSSKLIVKEAQAEKNRRLRLFADCIVSYVRSTGGVSRPNAQGEAGRGSGLGGSYF